MAFLKIVWPYFTLSCWLGDGISKNGLQLTVDPLWHRCKTSLVGNLQTWLLRTSPHLSQPFPLAPEEKVEHSVTVAAIELILLGLSLFKDYQKSIKSDY